MPDRSYADEGFAVAEALVAATIIAIALTFVAQLSVLAASTNARARRITRASWLAAAKLQELRSFTFEYDAAGGTVDDPRLARSSSDTLSRNVAGYFDLLAADGAATTEESHAAFLRRWSIEPDSTGSSEAVVITVAVFPGDGSRATGAQLTTIRRRTAPSWSDAR